MRLTEKDIHTVAKFKYVHLALSNFILAFSFIISYGFSQARHPRVGGT